MTVKRFRLISLEGGLSRYRRPLMGAVILWVFLYHVPVEIPRRLPWLPLLALQNIGYAGVDVFLLLSGIGLVYSAGKGSWKRFYVRRLARVLPAFWGVALLDVILYTHSYETPLSLFLKFSTIGFWVHRSGYEWFVPTIVALYALFPAVYWLHGRVRSQWAVTALLSATALLGCWWAVDHANYLVISLSRFPIFFIGVHVGVGSQPSFAEASEGLRFASRAKVGRRSSVVSRQSLLFGGAALLLGGGLLLGAFMLLEPVVLWRSGWFWYPFIVAAVPLVWLVLQLLHLVESVLWSHLAKPLMAILGFFGTITLEFYLAHDFVIKKGLESEWFALLLQRLPATSGSACQIGIILVSSVLLACGLYAATWATHRVLQLSVRKPTPS